MADTVQCPHCGQGYKVTAALSGKQVKCKRCGQSFRIPAGPTPEVAAGSRVADLLDEWEPRPPPSKPPGADWGAAQGVSTAPPAAPHGADSAGASPWTEEPRPKKRRADRRRKRRRTSNLGTIGVVIMAQPFIYHVVLGHKITGPYTLGMDVICLVGGLALIILGSLRRAS